MSTEWILILDYGGQYTQLIARRVREANIFCRIEPPDFGGDETANDASLKGVVLSGGPSSVFAENAPKLPAWFSRYEGPVLGICYGMQLLAGADGGEVAGGGEMEFGPAQIHFEKDAPLFQGLESGGQVWMSHGDRVTALPEGYERIGSTADLATAAIANVRARRYGVQFHPEVMHT
ncbi:MAG: glutamine-hydrolyzing GMP synthase, partial [Gemmatimonadetes bacterium]|nr:glutamine-hydrolyzing GMP synthase [Gemmatimonadota bacterium]